MNDTMNDTSPLMGIAKLLDSNDVTRPWSFTVKSDCHEVTGTVEPNATFPTNIHAVVGRNNSGKTHLLDHGHMSASFAGDSRPCISQFPPKSFLEHIEPLAHDPGLHDVFRLDPHFSSGPAYDQDYVGSAWNPDDPDEPDWYPTLVEAVRNSGYGYVGEAHVVAFATLQRVFDKAEPFSVVTIDCPERTLGPHLLQLWLGSLQSILAERNAVALIATHSAHVVQMSPASCVSILHRYGSVGSTSRPEYQTFAENHGSIERDVLGASPSHAPHLEHIKRAVAGCETYEEALEVLGDDVGMLGMAMAATVLSNRKTVSETDRKEA